MYFLSPFNLLGLSLLGVIIVLYLLRLRRKEQVVPSVLLWQPSVQDLQANAPIQKLRKNLLLFLQLLILMLVVLGVARPYLLTRKYQGQNLALILDASASMGATDERPSRFERARARAQEMVDRMSAGDKMTVIEAGARTRVLTGFTSDKGALKTALAAASVHDTASHLRESIVLALSLIKGQPRSTIYLLSDGAIDRVTDLNVGSVEFRYLPFGSGHNNLALTALDVRRTYAENATYQIFVTVENYSDQERATILELHRNGKLVAPRRIRVPAARGGRPGRHPELFQNLGFESGLITARIDESDDLAADNVAFAELAPRQKLNLLLVTQDNFLLERCLTVDSQIDLKRAKPSDYRPAKGWDVVIFDRVTKPPPPQGGVFQIEQTSPGSPVTVAGLVKVPTIVQWDRRHPVTRWLSLGDVRLMEARVGKPLEWARGLVEIENGPIVVAGEKSGRRVVWCGFDFTKSNWWRRPAFPIFIHNTVRWLAAGGKGREETTLYRTGQAVSIPVPEDTGSVTVTLPEGGGKLNLKPSQASITLDHTEQVGTYEIAMGDRKRTIGLSLLDRQESDIAPQRELRLGGARISAASSTRTNHEIWKWLVVVALAMMGLEWYVYHRGI